MEGVTDLFHLYYSVEARESDRSNEICCVLIVLPLCGSFDYNSLLCCLADQLEFLHIQYIHTYISLFFFCLSLFPPLSIFSFTPSLPFFLRLPRPSWASAHLS